MLRCFTQRFTGPKWLSQVGAIIVFPRAIAFTMFSWCRFRISKWWSKTDSRSAQSGIGKENQRRVRLVRFRSACQFDVVRQPRTGNQDPLNHLLIPKHGCCVCLGESQFEELEIWSVSDLGQGFGHAVFKVGSSDSCQQIALRRRQPNYRLPSDNFVNLECYIECCGCSRNSPAFTRRRTDDLPKPQPRQQEYVQLLVYAFH